MMKPTYLSKRPLDIIISIIALIISLPLLLFIAILVAIQLKGNPFYMQVRVGMNSNLFRLIKFKTMDDGRDLDGNLLPDMKRVTRLGRLLRNTSLDELPQLINVLAGSMSVVGPRPLLVKYLDHYTDEQRRRHHVRPGITGWAQISGRNSLSWGEKFKLDVWYVDNMSLRLDAYIVMQTIIKVIKRDGVNLNAEITMKPFDGTEN
jgi:undecaprenyl phosphate N,N'-diacetylbacillosamine 1-phosphate transferase